MNADELEELIKKLLAKGITVLVLVAGPAGELVGVTPGAPQTPPAISAPNAPSSDNSADRPGRGAPDTDPTADTGTGSNSGPGTAPGTGPDAGIPPETRPAPGGTAPGTGQEGAGTPQAPAAPGATPRAGGANGAGGVPTVPPEGTWSNGPGQTGTGQQKPNGAGGTGGTGGNEAGETGGGDAGTGGTGGGDAGSGDTGGKGQGNGNAGGNSGDSGSGGGGSGSGQDGAGGDAGAGADAGSGDDTRPGTGTAPPATGTGGGAGVNSAQGTTAAQKLGWGNPVRADDFTDGTEGWSIYDGAGHAGNGRRTPDAVSVQDGVLTLTGDSEGNTAGMAWNPGQKYGRWEGRVKAPASDPSYNALLLLWPDAENFPEGGEVDFMEMMDHTRQKTNLFLHYGKDNSQVSGDVEIDATQWHNWAVEWTPDHIAAFVDGKQWWKTTDTSILPPGPMHLCIQLDWFPKGGGGVKESTMQVDWVKQYTIDGASSGGASESGDEAAEGGQQEEG